MKGSGQFHYALTDSSRLILDGIWGYIAKKFGSVEIANGVVDSIVAGFPLLAKTPKAGHVVMVRVMHGRRDQASAYWRV